MEKEHLNSIATKIRAFADPGNHHSLRPHQVEMLDAIAIHLEKGETNGTLKAATGTGKTYALGAMAVASEEPTVIITPRKLIGDQTIKTFFDEEKFHLNVRENVGIYDSRRTNLQRKDALNKKILITTYPSFIRLVKEGKISADPHSKNFRSNIILDEAHRGTGFQTSKVLKPFLNNSLVTAWTATDQFYDGQRVDDRLFGKPNRIYTLGLAEAVRRGILTDGIHTVSVEVGIDGSDIEAQKNYHSDYTKEAVEKFAGMQAVQEHAVNMYMNYEHPETHIRFYGLPCVVTTQGVRAAEQTAKRFNTALGEGLAVVVSGKTPKNKLRNEEGTGILDRFDRGEIKVLCASDLLIEGFDSPNASLVFSLRPSVSPWLVEQMLGRGARKQDADYFRLYEHDKQTFAVNFFAQGMRPQLFSDIIQGTSVVTKTHTPRGPQTKRHKPAPYAMPYLETPVRTFATTTEQTSLQKEWDATVYPHKTPDWLTLTDSYSIRGGGRLRITEALRKIFALYDPSKERVQAVSFNDQEIRLQKMQSQHGLLICFSQEDWPKIELAAGVGEYAVLPEKTEGWLSKEESTYPEKVPGGGRIAVRKAVASILALYDIEKGGLQTIDYNGQKIKLQLMQASRSKQVVCIAHADWPNVEKSAGMDTYLALPEKTDAWVSPRDSTEILGANRAPVKEALEKILELYDRKIAGVQTIDYNDQKIKLQQVQASQRQPVCIAREDWSKLEAAAGVVPGIGLLKKTEEWLSMNNLAGMPGGNRSTIKTALATIMESYDSKKPGIQTIAFNGQEIQVQQMRASNFVAVCIARSDWPKLQKAAEASRADALRSESIAPKSIKPNADHITKRGERNLQ